VSASPWNTQPLKACLFDFGGTLDADGTTWQDRFYELYAKHGLHPDRETFRKAFYRADDSLTETRALEGQGFRKTVEEQAARVWEALAWDGPEDRLAAVVEDFWEAARRTVRRNLEILTELRSVFRLGIVSNFYGNLEPVCEELGIRYLFECLVDSNRVGVVKPDPRIFQAALRHLEVRAEETVFVGDNVYRDMEGARNVGMPHILLASRSLSAPAPCCPGDPVIRSLEELGPLLLRGTRSPKCGGADSRGSAAKDRTPVRGPS